MSLWSRLRARAGTLVVAGAIVATGSIAAGTAVADYYGTGVNPNSDGVTCPAVGDCGQGTVNGAGDLAPAVPGAKDPVVFGVHETINSWELAKAVVDGRLDLALVPDWVKQTHSFQDLAPELLSVSSSAVTELGDTVFYSSDAVVLGVYSTNPHGQPCPDGYICLYQDAEFNTTGDHDRAQFRQWGDTGQTIQLSAYGFNDETSSWINNKNRTDAVLWWDYPAGGSGNRRICLDSSSRSSHMGGWNDKASTLSIHSAGYDSDC